MSGADWLLLSKNKTLFDGSYSHSAKHFYTSRRELYFQAFPHSAIQFALAFTAVLGPTGTSPSLAPLKVLWMEEQRHCDFCCVCKQRHRSTPALAGKA